MPRYAAVRDVDGLYACNERLVSFIDGAFGEVAVVKVAACGVGCVTVTYNAVLKKYLMCVTDGGNTTSVKTFNQAIEAAQRWVQLETYIYADDEAGRNVTEALMRAARRGVLVRVLVDGWGARHYLTAAIERDLACRTVCARASPYPHRRHRPELPLAIGGMEVSLPAGCGMPGGAADRDERVQEHIPATGYCQCQGAGARPRPGARVARGPVVERGDAAVNWMDDYKSKLMDADHALCRIKSGDRVYYGGNAAIPRGLIEALAALPGVGCIVVGDALFGEQAYAAKLKGGALKPACAKMSLL